MASPDFPEPPPSVPATPLDECDAKLETLAANAKAWVEVGLPERAVLLRRCIAILEEVAEEWVDTACRAKGIKPGEAHVGEEWLGGPMTLMRNLRLLAEAIEAEAKPRLPGVRRNRDGRLIARVFPGNLLDKIMFGGFVADVFIEEGKEATQGRAYREKAAGQTPEGRVGLVLGAGNVASIGPMDALYKLYVDDEVVLLKTNPVNAYLGPFIERVFQPFSERGWFAICHGGAAVGAHLCEHPLVYSIHITGSDRTHDAIVWGTDADDATRRREANDPRNTKPISSELGAVTPIMVVPGDWSEKQLEFQARNVAGMVANNASFNCNAGKILVTARGWPLRDRFLEKVHTALAAVPPRKAYYPGAHDRYQGFLDHYPDARVLGEAAEDVVPWTLIPNVPPEKGEYALTNEAFCGILAETSLDVTTAADFIPEVVRFANDSCWGTLSCMVIIDPETERANQRAFDRAIDDLRYGGIAINCWAAMVYALVVTPWGAHPGHTLHDIQSGRGVVHNTYLLDHVHKTVVRAPFVIKPTPVYFADHKTQDELGRALTRFEATGSLGRLPPVIWAALRG